MSGPKSATYGLTGEARRRVEKQLQYESEALKCAAKISQLCRKAARIGTELNRESAKAGLKAKYGGTTADKEKAENFRAFFDEEVLSIRKTFSDSRPVVSGRYEMTDEAVNQKRMAAERLQLLCSRLEKLLEDAGEQLDQTKDTETKEKMMEKIRTRISFEGGEGEQEMLISQKRACASLLTGYLQMKLPETLNERLRSALNRLRRISDLRSLQTFETVTVGEVLREADQWREERKKEYDELMCRYQALCQMYTGDMEASISVPDTVEALREEIQTKKMEIQRQKEQEYIAECADAVMEEMGYQMIGTGKTVHQGSFAGNGERPGRYRNALYKFGTGTAVHITYAPDGKIAMELGGIAETSRIPDRNEAEELAEEMKVFCSEYTVFERKMLERGIIVREHFRHDPPSSECAKMIGIDEYEITLAEPVAYFRPGRTGEEIEADPTGYGGTFYTEREIE